jgi:catechol 2,3-dioxygenase
MGDVGLGYMPHAVAFNVWAGPDAKPAPAGAAGLRWFNVVVPDESALRAVETRLTSLGFAFSKVPGGIEAQDPSANVVRVVVD